MFADTIDAMTTDRPYRSALSKHTVKSELLKYRGQQFDPYICDVLLNSPLFDELFVNSTNKDEELSKISIPLHQIL